MLKTYTGSFHLGEDFRNTEEWTCGYCPLEEKGEFSTRLSYMKKHTTFIGFYWKQNKPDLRVFFWINY